MKEKFSKEELLSSAPVKTAITKMGIPAIMGMIVTALYNMVDTAYIGMLKDNNALTASSVAFPIFMLVLAFGQLLGVGSASAVGRHLGANDNEKANEVASTTVVISFVVGILFAFTGLMFLEPLFKIFGASNTVMPYAKDYGKWLFLAAIIEVPNQVFNCTARAETAVKRSATALIAAAVTNIILDPIFMFTFGLGVEGAAVATAIAQCVNFAVVASYFFTGNSLVKLSLKKIRVTKNWFTSIFASGMPTFVTQLLTSVTLTVTNLLAGSLANGDNIIAAHGVVLKVIVIGNYCIIGFMQGYQPLSAFAYGAKLKERFYDSYNFTRKACFTIGLVSTIVYIVFGKQLIGLFSQDPFILSMGYKFLVGICLTFTLMAFTVQLTVLYQAIGMGKEGVVVSALRQGLFYLPLVIILTKLFGVWGLIIVQPICDILSFLVCIKAKNMLFTKLDTFFAK